MIIQSLRYPLREGMAKWFIWVLSVQASSSLVLFYMTAVL